MATILNNYSISGGDTTSSTFTGTGGCVKVEATTTNINGNNTTLKIQSSDDQSTWKDIGQINILIGSGYYCSDPNTITGLYIRVLLVCNDSNSGTITITANEETSTADGTVPVNAIVTLTANQIANLFSSPIDIPEYPAVAGKYWVITAWTAINFVANTTPFDNDIYIKTDGVANEQANTGGVLTGGVDAFCALRPQGAASINSLAINKKLTISAGSDDTNNGDGTATLYISAFLITA